MTRNWHAAPANGVVTTAGCGGTGRYDPYLMIHKALRSLQADTLTRLGRMDPEDDNDTRAVLAQLRQLMEVADAHLRKENTFVHPAMEARAPGSTQRTAHDHSAHAQTFDRILAGCNEVEYSHGAARAAAALSLYRRFALYVAEDLVHMNNEETENNAVLWATHTDAEIMQIVERIVASIPPAQNAIFMRWMITANAPHDRAKLLGGMKTAMPSERFSGLVASLLPHLPIPDRDKLVGALG
jgi:hemerythrin HHE cation binding domain-containing protein